MIATQNTDKPITGDAPEPSKASVLMKMLRDGRIGLGVIDGLEEKSKAVSSLAPIPDDLISLNIWVPFRLTVNPTQITLERLDKAVSATIANDQIRVPYLFAGAKGANVKFRAMALTE